MNTGHLTINGLTKHVHASVGSTGLFREADQIFGALRAAKKGKKPDSVTTFDGTNLAFFSARAQREYPCSLDEKQNIINLVVLCS